MLALVVLSVGVVALGIVLSVTVWLAVIVP
jgi:hypothetical protein